MFAISSLEFSNEYLAFTTYNGTTTLPTPATGRAVVRNQKFVGKFSSLYFSLYCHASDFFLYTVVDLFNGVNFVVVDVILEAVVVVVL